MAVTYPQGTVIKKGSTSLGLLISLEHGGLSREVMDGNHLAIAAPTAGDFGNAIKYPAGIVDAGQYSGELYLEAGTDLRTQIHDAATTYTVDIPGMADETFQAFLVEAGVTVTMGELVKQSFTLEVTGTIEPAGA